MSAEKKQNLPVRRAKALGRRSYWANLIVGLKHSSQEFYTRVQQVLAEHEVPDMTISRIGLKEGRMLSARREYLRIQRERFVIDVCGAPFGTAFFVSIRSGDLPLRIGILAALVAALIGISIVAPF